MLTINPNEEKIIKFVVEINGVASGEMNGHVRFSHGDVEYGFPVKFHENEITATIKPLNEIFEGKLKNGTTLTARLDLAAPKHNYYFNPWEDEIEIKMPISVEAEVINNSETTKGPSVKAKVIKEEKVINKSKPRGGKLSEEEKEWTKNKLKNITDKQIREYITKNGSKIRAIQDILLADAVKAAGTSEKYKVFVEIVKALKKPKRV